MNNRKNFKKIFFILTLSIFWVKGILFLDPDFGWHLRLGNLILNSGIPKTDPFSYTMPSFPFIAHEWLTDVILAKLYPALGQIGLAGIYTSLALFSLIISLGKAKSSYLKTLPFILGTAILLGYSGIRHQVISWLFLALLLKIILNESTWKKWRWMVPPFFIGWTNLHGSFAIGITTLFLVIFLKSWREKKLWLEGLLVSILSLLATFINPYGPRLWWEIWLTFSDRSLRWTIAEWQPSLFFFNPSFTALLTLSAILIWRYRKKFKLEELGLYLLFLFQGISSLRHIPLWVIVSLPTTITGLSWFYQEAKLIKEGRQRFAKAYNFAIAGSLTIFFLQSIFSLGGAKSITEEAFYPKKAVKFLKANLPQGQIFSEYGWGGYLIWKLPEKKVFIDGRMPSWRWQASADKESNYAMKDYNELTNGRTEYIPIFQKYGVETVLWSPVKPKSLGEQLEDKLKDALIRLGISKKEADFDFLLQFQKEGWRQIYQDSLAVIYQKLPPH